MDMWNKLYVFVKHSVQFIRPGMNCQRPNTHSLLPTYYRELSFHRATLVQSFVFYSEESSFESLLCCVISGHFQEAEEIAFGKENVRPCSASASIIAAIAHFLPLQFTLGHGRRSSESSIVLVKLTVSSSHRFSSLLLTSSTLSTRPSLDTIHLKIFTRFLPLLHQSGLVRLQQEQRKDAFMKRRLLWFNFKQTKYQKWMENSVQTWMNFNF